MEKKKSKYIFKDGVKAMEEQSESVRITVILAIVRLGSVNAYACCASIHLFHLSLRSVQAQSLPLEIHHWSPPLANQYGHTDVMCVWSSLPQQ